MRKKIRREAFVTKSFHPVDGNPYNQTAQKVNMLTVKRNSFIR